MKRHPPRWGLTAKHLRKHMPRQPDGYTEQHVKQVPYGRDQDQSAEAGVTRVMTRSAIRRGRFLASAIVLSLTAATVAITLRAQAHFCAVFHTLINKLDAGAFKGAVPLIPC
jgi:hypothetical protein